MRPGVIGGHAKAGVVQILRLQVDVQGAVVRRSIAAARVDSRELVVGPGEDAADERVVQISLSSAAGVRSCDIIQMNTVGSGIFKSHNRIACDFPF